MNYDDDDDISFPKLIKTNDLEEDTFLEKTIKLLNEDTYRRSLPLGPNIILTNITGEIIYKGRINNEFKNFLGCKRYKFIFDNNLIFENLKKLINYIFNDKNIININEYIINAQIIYSPGKQYEIYIPDVLESFYLLYNMVPCLIKFSTVPQSRLLVIPLDIMPKDYIKKNNENNEYYVKKIYLTEH